MFPLVEDTSTTLCRALVIGLACGASTRTSADGPEMIIKLTCAVAAILAATSCGNQAADEAVTASSAPCGGSIPLESSRQAAAGDQANVRAGGLVNSAPAEFRVAPGSTLASELPKSKAAAVLQVVEREPAVAVSQRLAGLVARPSSSAAERMQDRPRAAVDGFHVVRSTRFVVVKVLTGQLPTCLSLDVPGGTDSSLNVREENGYFPATLAPGDRVVAFFEEVKTPRGVEAVASAIFAEDGDGKVRLPLDLEPIVDIDELTAS